MNKRLTVLSVSGNMLERFSKVVVANNIFTISILNAHLAYVVFDECVL